MVKTMKRQQQQPFHQCLISGLYPLKKSLSRLAMTMQLVHGQS
ncbi:hypothetical protein CCACVL1_26424 [Corchorus capsularis]|uniref:Uncharacterized protein n=1 Tax=Corchorus capsularis TaxID=210143 RepID=A0A1R3GEU2_COCAP|nr:hypothetical protein CCACVL1_26424 [Corchorus capsularis]